MMTGQPHFLGVARSDNRSIEIAQATRFQHTYVLGQTGTGKSTWARQSFLQDAYAGRGGCYFDFHGEDAAWLLDHIPPERAEDVVYVNPLDPAAVIGFNPLDGVAPAHFAAVTDEIVGSLRHLHQASWGARMDDILMNAVRPLFDLPGESKGTLLGAVRMLNDEGFRRFVVHQCSEQTVRDFWFSEYAAWGKTDQAHNVNSSLNKIRRFQSAPVLRHTLGQQRSRLDLRAAIARRRLVILDLNKWRMGAVNASTLASLILSRLIYEATHRDVPTQDGRPVDTLFPGFHVVIDEFQSVTSLAIVEALAGIRKSRVSFTLAHQHTAQIDPDILAAIKGNIGTKVLFRVGGDDAERFAKTLEITNPKELTSQADHQFFVQYKSGASVVTTRGRSELMDFPPTGQGRRIRGYARGHYARPIDEVAAQYERWIERRHVGRPTGTRAKTGREKPGRSRRSGPAEGTVQSASTVKGEEGRRPRRSAAGPRSLGAIMRERGYEPRGGG